MPYLCVCFFVSYLWLKILDLSCRLISLARTGIWLVSMSELASDWCRCQNRCLNGINADARTHIWLVSMPDLTLCQSARADIWVVSMPDPTSDWFQCQTWHLTGVDARCLTACYARTDVWLVLITFSDVMGSFIISRVYFFICFSMLYIHGN